VHCLLLVTLFIVYANSSFLETGRKDLGAQIYEPRDLEVLFMKTIF
jgi:hypothetical protein